MVTRTRCRRVGFFLCARFRHDHPPIADDRETEPGAACSRVEWNRLVKGSNTFSRSASGIPARIGNPKLDRGSLPPRSTIRRRTVSRGSALHAREPCAQPRRGPFRRKLQGIFGRFSRSGAAALGPPRSAQPGTPRVLETQSFFTPAAACGHHLAHGPSRTSVLFLRNVMVPLSNFDISSKPLIRSRSCSTFSRIVWTKDPLFGAELARETSAASLYPRIAKSAGYAARERPWPESCS